MTQELKKAALEKRQPRSPIQMLSLMEYDGPVWEPLNNHGTNNESSISLTDIEQPGLHRAFVLV
jgi:hypothetical protein